MFRADPVGCTGTIISGLYHEAGIPIPREVAGLLLARATLRYPDPALSHLYAAR